jgi:hypothetical protein
VLVIHGFAVYVNTIEERVAILCEARSDREVATIIEEVACRFVFAH